MDAERWQQVKQIFQSAIERPAPERDGFISQGSADDLESPTQPDGGEIERRWGLADATVRQRLKRLTRIGAVEQSADKNGRLSKELVSNAM